MGDLSGKNAVVTGARRGIGWATIELFAKNGANIWACSHTPDAEFEIRLNALAQKYNVWLEPVYFDLEDDDSIKQGITSIIRKKLPIDVLVNNAGVPYNGTAAMTPVSDLRQVLNINFVAQMYVTQLISRAMMRKKTGSIIHVGSIGGIEGRAGYLAYGSSKTALMWSAKCLSKELAPYGIRVNAVAPGLVDTEMGAFKPKGAATEIVESSALGRMGTSDEIAEAILFLASERSSFITGSVINVDGGRII